MKKLLLVFTFCLLLTGCGSDKLVCTKDNAVTGESSKVVYQFKDDKIDSIKSTTKYETEAEATDACNEYNSWVATDEDAKSEYTNNEAVCNGKKMTTIVSGRKYDNSESKATIKEYSENNGWTCE